MVRALDGFLNRFTMYRLTLYYLTALLVAAVVLAAAGRLPFDPFALLLSIGVLLAVCTAANGAFAWAFGVVPNAESARITALILALIITPGGSAHDLWFLVWAGVLAMASKYMLAVHGKHVFNPAAFAVAATYLAMGDTASWWVGDASMLPLVLVGGVLIVRKLRRADLVASSLAATGLLTVAFAGLHHQALFGAVRPTLLYSPLLFFAFVILTEPLTTPALRPWRLAYGALAGALMTPQLHLGSFYLTPELAILAANVLSFAVSPKATLVLRLKERVRIAPDIYDFVFAPPRRLAYAPGQYMEWTLGHDNPDTRGNRRYFTLASAPTEDTLRLGVKFSPGPSTYKQALLSMRPGRDIVAMSLAGEFTLPEDPKQPCVFIAGGIGITPFRSMLKYLLDRREKRPIVLFYAASDPDAFVYRDVLDHATRVIGTRIVYTITDPAAVPDDWRGETGRVTAAMIRRNVQDVDHSLFYVSGPPGMVDGFKDVLTQLGVRRRQIRTDYFPGF